MSLRGFPEPARAELIRHFTLASADELRGYGARGQTRTEGDGARLAEAADLDSLLGVDPVLRRTRLAWLGTGPVSASPAAVKDELEKLAFLRGMDAHALDLSALPAERRRFLAGSGSG